MSKKDPVIREEDMALFHEAMRDVSPLPAVNRIVIRDTISAAIPHRKIEHEEQVSPDTLSDHVAINLEAGDSWNFMRPGISQQTLKRLRRGYWCIQGELDLHGLTRDEARQVLSSFLDRCGQQGMRCVRIIHGKGLSSRNREPVLKTRIGNWLMQRADVLAFCQAKPEHGGGGALLILLKVFS